MVRVVASDFDLLRSQTSVLHKHALASDEVEEFRAARQVDHVNRLGQGKHQFPVEAKEVTMRNTFDCQVDIPSLGARLDAGPEE